MSKVFLIGFMGVGKSTVGKRLASKLNYSFLDLDHAFEEKYKISIKDFFTKYDEALFRKLEREMLFSTKAFTDIVIATGGGTACFFESIDWMNKNGLTVYLEMPVKGIVDRLTEARKPRPLIQSIPREALTEFVTGKIKEREPFYQKAKISLPALDIDYNMLISTILNYTHGLPGS